MFGGRRMSLTTVQIGLRDFRVNTPAPADKAGNVQIDERRRNISSDNKIKIK